MIIFILTSWGERGELEVESTDTIKDLYEKLAVKFGTKIDTIYLNFQGKTLRKQHMTIEECGIYEGCRLILLIKFEGGGSITGEADIVDSVKEFCDRLQKYGKGAEELKIDVGYYLGQSGHKKIQEGYKTTRVTLGISNDLDEDWIKNIKKAVFLLNQGAPGLSICYEMKDEPKKFDGHSIFVQSISEEQVYTEGNIFNQKITIISLSNEWDCKRQQGTALHEIMHALGFEHEESRKDRDRFVKVKELDNHNYKIEEFCQELTPFDPFSVMLYSESEKMERIEDVRVWKLKKDHEQTNNLSELDKVSLNILYPPVKSDENYDPKIGRTGLYYCGREVMHGHNYPADDICDGVGGPDSGPNCPACRTLRTDKMDQLNGVGVMQGYSGMVYCGSKMKKLKHSHDGIGGPDNGPPGDKGLKFIYDEAEIKRYLNKFQVVSESDIEIIFDK